MNYIISILLGYGLGCIQASYLLGKLILKKDIRKFGNGNAGASNATIVFGKRYGLITVLLDAFKAVLSIGIIRYIFKESLSFEQLSNLIFLNGFFVIIGHNFPFYMGFKGGKGTAALLGLLFALDYRLGIVALLVMILVIGATNYMVIGTFSLLIMLMSYTLMFHMDYLNFSLALILSVMSVYKHSINIVNIKDGTETKVLAALKKSERNEDKK